LRRSSGRRPATNGPASWLVPKRASLPCSRSTRHLVIPTTPPAAPSWKSMVEFSRPRHRGSAGPRLGFRRNLLGRVSAP
jgi:hypothetical protein